MMLVMLMQLFADRDGVVGQWDSRGAGDVDNDDVGDGRDAGDVEHDDDGDVIAVSCRSR